MQEKLFLAKQYLAKGEILTSQYKSRACRKLPPNVYVSRKGYRVRIRRKLFKFNKNFEDETKTPTELLLEARACVEKIMKSL